MRDFNPRPELRPRTFQFPGTTTSGSFAGVIPRSPFSHAEERKLASELLEVTSEAELAHVLSDLSKTARKGVEPVGSNVTGPLEGLLKTVAKKALPSIAAAVGTSVGGPERDAATGNLGSLVNQALQAKVAGMTAADPELARCRQLMEKYRQFVRLAGKATKAAAAAPGGVSPVAVAQKILADLAHQTLKRKPLSAGLAGKFVEGLPAAATTKAAARAGSVAEPALAAAAATPSVRAGKSAEGLSAAGTMKPAALAGKFADAALATAATRAAEGQATRRKTRAGAQAQVERVCSVCQLSPGACQCRKTGRTGRWFRNGSIIVVNC
jgi:hypothetical protein